MDSLTFDVALHAGTLVAILWYFWKDWVDLTLGFFRIVTRRRIGSFQEKLILYLVLATIPAAIAGFVLQDMMERSFRNPGLIVFPLIGVSFLMIFVENRARNSHPLHKITLPDSLLIGLPRLWLYFLVFPGQGSPSPQVSFGVIKGKRRHVSPFFSPPQPLPELLFSNCVIYSPRER